MNLVRRGLGSPVGTTDIGEAANQKMGWKRFHLMLDIASGNHTWAETTFYDAARPGPLRAFHQLPNRSCDLVWTTTFPVTAEAVRQ